MSLPSLSRHPVDVGLRSEAAVISDFVKRGYAVLVPQGFNHRYDFVLELDGRFVRVQVKTARLRNGVVAFAPRSVRSNMNGVFTRPYGEEVDLFAAYCPENQKTYVIPAFEVTTEYVSLRIDPPANGQVKRIRWAADYELPG